MSGALAISASGMKMQNQRMKVIAENIANANIASNSHKQDPYRRKVPTLSTITDQRSGAELIKMKKTVADQSDFVLKYQPYHPAANAEGMVRYPNVNLLVENADMKEAQRSFEVNLHSFEITKSNQNKLLEALK
ncbi:MAG: flagellar basal body rod protein FlgC [Proteobacteria bacterium]|nr:flagellar basal body rod protein FlgC [Pseudomonadota bacterium]